MNGFPEEWRHDPYAAEPMRALDTERRWTLNLASPKPKYGSAGRGVVEVLGSFHHQGTLDPYGSSSRRHRRTGK